jgi:hypothetical protein
MAGVSWVQTMNQDHFQYRDESFRRAAGEASDFAKTVSDAALKRAVRAGGYFGTGALHTCRARVAICRAHTRLHGIK